MGGKQGGLCRIRGQAYAAITGVGIQKVGEMKSLERRMDKCKYAINRELKLARRQAIKR
jgi:hypothetical protein